LRELNIQREAMLEFHHDIHQGKTPVHEEVGLRPSELSLPAIEDFLQDKSSSAFAESIAAYKRLQRLAVKAKVGTSFSFVYFSPEPEKRSLEIEIDESGLRATKVLAPGALLGRGDLALENNQGKWGSIMLQPAIPSGGQIYVEFLIELSNPVCELLIGVCDGSQRPSKGHVTFMRDKSWMYYCYNGRRYTQGVGYNLSQIRMNGQRAGVGDRVGILIDQSCSHTVDGLGGSQGKCAGVYVNGELQGALLTERALEADQKQWPSQLWIAVDMYGENQRVAILPDSSRTVGVSARGAPSLDKLSKRLCLGMQASLLVDRVHARRGRHQTCSAAARGSVRQPAASPN